VIQIIVQIAVKEPKVTRVFFMLGLISIQSVKMSSRIYRSF